jgi:hypothetical protein
MLALFGHGAMSDLSPLCAPKRTFANAPPEGWWTVRRNGMPVRHFPGKEKAERFATDPEYRASLVTAKVWKRAKGK